MPTDRERVDRPAGTPTPDPAHVEPPRVEWLPDVVLRLDRDGRILFANDAIRTLTGEAPEACVGRAVADICPTPELGERLRAARAEAVATRRPVSFEDEWPTAAGRRWLECRVFPEHVVGGTVHTVLVVGRDFTEAHEAIAALHASQARDRALVAEAERARAELEKQRALLEESQRLAHVGSWELDLTTGAITWSDEMNRIFGRAPDAPPLTYEVASQFTLPEDREHVRATFEEARSAERDAEAEYRVRRADGTIATVVTRVRTVTAPDGRPVRIVGATQDVSGRCQLESQFRQAQRMEAVGRLAGGIAHDFNNLLSSIVGGVDLACAALPVGSEVRSDLADVRDSAMRAADLTRQLLTFSRQQPQRTRVLDLRDVVRRAERLLRRLLPDGISLDVLVADAASVVRADATQLEQVLVNLVVNARDAIEAAHPGARPDAAASRITVEVGVRELPHGLDAAAAGGPLGAGRYVALVVRDSGVGMDVETRTRIFEPFFTTKPEGKGTGLGLSTVFGIVVQSGGAITVETAPGAGATFTVFLPEVTAPVDRIDSDDSASPRGGSETVLLVEDERAVRETATRILERSGYCVIAARHGADALLAWRERHGRVDIVVTDLRMPAMGGRTLIDRLRAERPDLPAVVMSGYRSEHDEAETAMLERELFMEKPFTAETLLGYVRAALDGVEVPGRA